jgi:TRAP transporter TAXI family solute receptor
MKKYFVSVITIIALIAITAVNSDAQIKVLSGLDGGTYFHLATDIAHNSTQPVEVLTSNGSMDNFKQLMADNDINIAFMQYDVLLTNKLLNNKLQDEVNVLFPLFLDEEIHLIAKKGSKIKKLKDLKGKKVAIGTPEQGTHVTALTIKEKTGIDWDNVEMGSNEAYEALMRGEIDAYFYVGGMPINSLLDLPDTAQIQLVNIKDKRLNDIYRKKKIEKGTYLWQKKTVKTYAVPTLIVVKIKDMSLETEKQVNKLLDDINNNIKKMQETGHPKWKEVYYRNQDIDWPYYYVRAKVE